MHALSSFTMLFNVRYCSISWLNISSGIFIKDYIIYSVCDFEYASWSATLGRRTRGGRCFRTRFGVEGVSGYWSIFDGRVRDRQYADCAKTCIKDPFRISSLDGDRYWRVGSWEDHHGRGPVVDRTSTGVHETAVSTPAPVVEEPTEEPATVDMFTSGIGAATSESRREIRSLEEPATVEMFTSRIGDMTRSSLKRIATDATTVQDSAVGTYPVDRSSTTLGPASRTTSEYRASTETGTKVLVPVMITMAGGPVVARTSTGVCCP